MPKQITIKQLAAHGWVGSDADLAISLFEYGLAWKEYKTGLKTGLGNGRKPGDVKFYFGGWGEDGNEFDYAWYSKDTDVQEEWGWALTESFVQTMDNTLAVWLTIPLPYKVYDLVNYWGWQEIFGDSHNWLTIKE